jgi:hypothetical protein
MPEDRIEIRGLDDDQKAHLARAVEEYAVAEGDADREVVSLADEPKAVAERLRYADDAVELYRDSERDVDEVRFVLRGLDHQLERIDEGKPDRDEDYERSKSKREAMTGRAHLFEVVREQAEEQGVAYGEGEIHAPSG